MRRKGGFTLLELMVTLLILGVLSATAMPLYHTWTQRAYGTEAALMMKQIMDGEIMYFLAHDEFFPEGSGSMVMVREDGTAVPGNALSEIKEALKVAIPAGHHLDYTIQNYGPFCLVQIDAVFPLFKNGQRYLWAVIDGEGRVQYVSLGELASLLGG
jgi:prepilin-type N-terminal cleavage/methylation domain-containing protein